MLDTPGMRVLKPWSDAGLDAAFADVEEVAGRCRFGDCRHSGEPGCAVRAAVAEGALSPDRVAAYERLRREAAFLERRGDQRARAEERRRSRAVRRELGRRDRPRA